MKEKETTTKDGDGDKPESPMKLFIILFGIPLGIILLALLLQNIFG